jgi:hypothetical protein
MCWTAGGSEDREDQCAVAVNQGGEGDNTQDRSRALRRQRARGGRGRGAQSVWYHNNRAKVPNIIR